MYRYRIYPIDPSGVGRRYFVWISFNLKIKQFHPKNFMFKKMYKFPSFQQINLCKMFIQAIPIKLMNQKTNDSNELHSKSITSFEFTISCDMTWYHRCPTRLSHQPSICQKQKKLSPRCVLKKQLSFELSKLRAASEVPVGASAMTFHAGRGLRAPFSRCLWKMVYHCQTARTNLNQPAFALYRCYLF